MTVDNPLGFEKEIPMHEQKIRPIESITLVDHEHGSLWIDGRMLEAADIDPEAGRITMTLSYDEISISLGGEQS